MVAFPGAAVSLLKEKIPVAAYAVFAIPIVGIAVSAFSIGLLLHYNQHLEGCRDRCVEIESQFGGKTFTQIKRISNAAIIDGVRRFQVICAIFAVIWAVLLIGAHDLKTEPLPAKNMQGASQTQG